MKITPIEPNVKIKTFHIDGQGCGDVVAFKDGARLVAADLHHDAFLHAESPQVPYTGPA